MGLELQAGVGEGGNLGSAGRLDPQRCRGGHPVPGQLALHPLLWTPHL